MTARSHSGLVVGVVAAALCIAAAAGVQAYRESHHPGPPVTAESLYITSGSTIRRLTTGYHALAADLYWIRAIQYYGGTKLKVAGSPGALPLPAPAPSAGPNAYPLLYPMLDVTTSLDPRFNIAYRFGSIFLADAYPSGAGRPDLAIALLEKGLRERPDRWEYMQDIGFVHYWWRHDYTAAAEWFKRAGETDGAPWWLKSLAANTLTEGGDRNSSRLMWQSILQSAENDWLKNDAERRLAQLDTLDQIDNVQRVVDRAGQAGLVRDWQTIVRARLLPGIPVDPSGTPFEIDARGRVRLSPRSPLFPLPDEPQRMRPPQ